MNWEHLCTFAGSFQEVPESSDKILRPRAMDLYIGVVCMSFSTKSYVDVVHFILKRIHPTGRHNIDKDF